VSVIADPRLVDAKAPTPQDVARSTRGNLSRLGQALISVIRNVFPSDMNITFTATQYNGKWKVEFKPPAVKENGYRD
jgi:hypothetical protein